MTQNTQSRPQTRRFDRLWGEQQVEIKFATFDFQVGNYDFPPAHRRKTRLPNMESSGWWLLNKLLLSKFPHHCPFSWYLTLAISTPTPHSPAIRSMWKSLTWELLNECYWKWTKSDECLFNYCPQVALKLGWKPARTAFDLLPLILSANGHEWVIR